MTEPAEVYKWIAGLPQEKKSTMVEICDIIKRGLEQEYSLQLNINIGKNFGYDSPKIPQGTLKKLFQKER